MRTERPPAVAGLFYPAAPADLADDVATYLDAAPAKGAAPKALIVPHAGFVYSGPIAGSGYRCLAPHRDTVTRVVLIGPSHRAVYRGIATTGADAFVTPLGRVNVDREAVREAERLPQVVRHDAAHAPEHSLEVHLPFLQVVLEAFSIVPLLAGEATAEEVAEVLELLWGGEETLVVVSSDLSHYHDYDTARTLDRETSAAIEACDEAALHGRRACGHVAIKGLLVLARRHGLVVTRLDLRSSGDTAGPRDQVVGYGTWAFAEA